MKIDGIAIHLLRSITRSVDMPDQAGMVAREIGAVLVEVRTDDGVTGYGESFFRSLEDNRFLAASVRSLGRRLLGKNPLDVQQRWHELYGHAKRSGAYGALSALDEAMCPALEHLKANALEIYQPSLDYVGGVTAAHRVGVLVETFGKRLVPHTLGPIVNFTASLHVAAAQRVCALTEFPVLSRSVANPGQVHAGTYVVNVAEISLQPDGTLRPPERPGIGIEIDWEALKAAEVDRMSVDG